MAPRSSTLLPASAALTLALAGCTTTTHETVYIPVVAPTPPSSLTPQPVVLFNQTKAGRKLFTLDAEFPYCDVETGKVIEFVDPELEALQRQIAEKLGYRLVDHRMELFGVRLGRDG